ncbi:ABC transporter permease [Cellulosimicrobium sp. NPDC057862]|uniref:ABC transporter permease n=1 Tax=Cellulosimicrobium sp. NPDC057862 TaxID=3346266 RepID=UPI00366CE531
MSNTPNDAPQGGALENQIELLEVEGLSQGQIVRRRFFHHKGAVVALVVLIGIVLLAITSIGIGGWHGWYEYKASGQGSTYPLVDGGRPSSEHIFGQDEAGRDVFARVMQGTQTSLLVVLAVGVIATLAGVLVGALSGYYRGQTDSWLMRFTDLIITMPVIVIGAVLALLSGGSNALILGAFLGLVLWPPLARLVRGEFLSLREREFVDAARVAGASDRRIIFKHMLPNAVGVIIVNVTLLMSSAILLETALSYLGVGIQAPATSLGKLISDYQEAFATRPWLFWWPGLFIVAIALCVNFIGDGLRDAFDPRQKRIPSERKMARAQRVARPKATAATSGTTGEAGAS